MNSAGMNYAQRLGARLKRRRGPGRTERVDLITGFPDEIDVIYLPRHEAGGRNHHAGKSFIHFDWRS